MFFKGQLLNHLKELKPALDRIGADAFLNVRNFILEVRYQGRPYVFYPQFMTVDERGEQRYTPQFQPNVFRFIGWCPYFNKRWELAADKLKFKEYAVRNGLSTPEYWTDASVEAEHVVVKRRTSSFGVGTRGPFRSSQDTKLQVSEGEYYERFVWGKTIKVWFWNETPICCELADFGSIAGDGNLSIRELLRQMFEKREGKANPESFSEFLAYQGKSLDSVPGLYEIQPLDFKYGSKLLFPLEVQDIDLRRNPIPGTEEQLREIGACLVRGIPEEIRPNTVFTVDAILDKDHKLWILEMNCNPFLHPYIYPPLIEAWASNPQSPLNQIYGVPQPVQPGVQRVGPPGIPPGLPPMGLH